MKKYFLKKGMIAIFASVDCKEMRVLNQMNIQNFVMRLFVSRLKEYRQLVLSDNVINMADSAR
jgi:hypothetical protein